MPETLNLEKALEEAQEEKSQEEQTQETTEKTAEDTQTQEKKEDTETKTETKTEEKQEEKDTFADFTEITELNKQFVTLPDGKRVKVTDLIDGNMRQEDYTQKTMELAESRHQVELAAASAKAPKAEKEKSAVIDLTEQNKAIETALTEMDDTDPMRVIFQGLFTQNNQIIDFINNQTKANAEAATSVTAEDNAKHAQRLISEAMEREAKNYNLPVIKGADGEETKIKELWDQLVLTELRNTNENLTLAQFNHRVSQIGKNAYKRLRTIISVASANKPKEETADDKASSQKETKDTKTTEETAKTDENKNKGLSLGERIDNAFDTIGK